MQLETYDDRKVSDANPLPVAVVPGPSTGIAASDVIDVTLTLDTSAYAAGDVLAATQELENAVPVAGGTATLVSLVVLDESDQEAGFDLLFFDADTALGTENDPPSISDGGGRTGIGAVSVGVADFIDLGGCRQATVPNLALKLKAASDQTSLWVAAISRGGTPTYGATAIRLKLGMDYT